MGNTAKEMEKERHERTGVGRDADANATSGAYIGVYSAAKTTMWRRGFVTAVVEAQEVEAERSGHKRVRRDNAASRAPRNRVISAARPNTCPIILCVSLPLPHAEAGRQRLSLFLIPIPSARRLSFLPSPPVPLSLACAYFFGIPSRGNDWEMSSMRPYARAREGARKGKRGKTGREKGRKTERKEKREGSESAQGGSAQLLAATFAGSMTRASAAHATLSEGECVRSLPESGSLSANG